MTQFRARKSLFILVGVGMLVLGVTGCFKPGTHSRSDLLGDRSADLNSATFVIPAPVKGVARDPQMTEGFSIPASKLFNFTACVKNPRTFESLVGHPFVIEGGPESLSVRSDASGCLNWSERMVFDFLSGEKYLPIRRRIVGRGMQSGVRELRLAINPWNFRGKGDDVVDLSYSEVPSSYLAPENEVESLIAGKSREGEPVKRDLWINQMDLQIEPETDQTSPFARRISFWMKPGIQLQDLTGQRFIHELKEARLQVNAQIQLVSENGSKRQITGFLNKDETLDVEREGELYRARSRGIFDTVATNGRLILWIRVSAVGGPSGLRPFEAKYEIAAKSLTEANTYPVKLLSSGGSEGSIEPESSLIKTDGVDNEPLPSGVTRLRPYNVSFLTTDRLGVGTQTSETSTTRSIRYAVTACIRSPVQGASLAAGGVPVRNVEFTVVPGDGGAEKKIRTGSEPPLDGCLRWEEEVEHRFYECERFVNRTVVIRHESGFEERREISINPWAETSFLFGGDAKKDPDYVRTINSKSCVRSKLVANSFRVEAVEARQYEIDAFLNPKMIKRVRLTIPLKVLRHSNIAHGISVSPAPLRDGIYVVGAAIYAKGKDPIGQEVELIAPMRGGRRLVRVRGGDAEFDADFPVSDFRLMKARGNLVFEIRPVREQELSTSVRQGAALDSAGVDLDALVDKESGLETFTFVGVLNLSNDHGGGSLVPVDHLSIDPSDRTDRTQPEKPVLSDDLRPLAGMTLEKLFKKKAEQDESLARRLREKSELSDVLAAGNLEYVPLFYENQSWISAVLKKNNRAVPSSNAVDYLLNHLNRTVLLDSGIDSVREPATRQKLVELIEGRREIDVAMAHRLCLLFFDDVMPKLSIQQGGSKKENLIGHLVRLCVKDLRENSPSDVFAVDRKLRVIELGQTRFMNAYSTGVGVGADVSFSRGSTQNLTYSLGWAPLKMFDQAGKIPALSFLNLISGTGVTASVAANRVDQQGISESSGVQIRQSLNLEQINVLIEFKRYESCAAIRVHPGFWERNPQAVNLLSAPAEAVAGVIGRGLFVCTGYESKEPLQKVERYYSIVQEHPEEVQIDAADLRNQSWFLMMRGQGDFTNLMNLLAAKKKGPSEVVEPIEPGTMAMDRLEASFDAYRGVMPSVPGIYTMEKKPVAAQERIEWYELWKKMF